MNTFKIALTAMIATALGACAAPREDPVQQAIDDFVVVSQLEEVDQIRHRDQLHYEALNDYHVILKDRKNSYLVRFNRRCVELRDRLTITPDIRHEAHVLRSRFDTIRGCRIEAIYPINEGQVEELKSLGDVPGSTL